MQPAVKSNSGNVVIEVADGKQVGYKIGSADVVQLGDVIPNLKEFTEDTASSMVKSYADIMDFGFKIGKAQGGDNAILSYIKGDLTNKVDKLTSGLDGKADKSILKDVKTRTWQRQLRRPAFAAAKRCPARATSLCNGSVYIEQRGGARETRT